MMSYLLTGYGLRQKIPSMTLEYSMAYCHQLKVRTYVEVSLKIELCDDPKR